MMLTPARGTNLAAPESLKVVPPGSHMWAGVCLTSEQLLLHQFLSITSAVLPECFPADTGEIYRKTFWDTENCLALGNPTVL